ncbi:hypothetical protein K440DRAFT_664928 [Wilcoxina mikolae CBS 423.85]|nr:hypothetical protein K440DRAFT_664928 [Wilcoxina mikolae CBS 423.85]
MNLNLALVVTVLPFLAQASPVAVAEAQPAADANPIAIPEAIPNSLHKRDNWCWVDMSDGPVNCRYGPGTQYDVRTRITSGNTRFGVSCKRNGQRIHGDPVWDWVPGWGCWVSSYYSRGSPFCESGLSWC